ncbi:SAF domain-containing protein [Actinosynnema mirum]|uniref:SAF domain protein n=1 Tax=Actinosynnema mirum (strain ATCC 29888 / DSM 43827 / JCM 3225 / NBRC 14064 / NCIMB 13271 / NRRL B-12336 / IMRU 3971 / 101) TaxID=446462 RepID=C6WJF6_ACTMD|nr:SAF domain-containing protein [Actinosynnema mirum]ACU34588.1 SAF domain protein [Actinosynnema mirum DSM 43827]
MNLARKLFALALALLGLGALLWPDPATTTVLVAARDLPPGVALAREDVRAVELPPGVAPEGVVAAEVAVGRALVSTARAGEPLTDARLTGVDPEAASVAVRFDPVTAGLLRTGSRVDVVGVGRLGSTGLDPIGLGSTGLSPPGPEARVLAQDAVVVALREESVVLLMPRDLAAAVAAEALGQEVGLTLRSN